LDYDNDVVPGNIAINIRANAGTGALVASDLDLAQAIFAGLAGAGGAVMLTPMQIGLPAAAMVRVSSGLSVARAYQWVTGQAPTSAAAPTLRDLGAVEVYVHESWSAAQVAQAVADAINRAHAGPDTRLEVTARAQGTSVLLDGSEIYFDPGNAPLSVNDNADDPNNLNFFTSTKVDGSLVHVLNHVVTSQQRADGSTQNYLPYSRSLPGDYPDWLVPGQGPPVPGAPNSGTRAVNLLQRNRGEGWYMDDFIIGLAGRGETVTNIPADPTVVASLAGVLQGPYQLEIRRGTEFVPGAQDWLIADRIDENLTLRIPNPDTIGQGDTFTISDGVNQVTYQFVDTMLPPPAVVGGVPIYFHSDPLTRNVQTPGQLAEDVVAAINATTQLKNVKASIRIGANGDGSGDRVDLFNAAWVTGIDQYIYGEKVHPDIQPYSFPQGKLTITQTCDAAAAASAGNLLRDTILGQGITPVGDATYVGGNTLLGQDMSSGLWSDTVNTGIILTTGNVKNAQGPNTADASTGMASGLGDADLDQLFTQWTGQEVHTQDTSSLTFDFTTNSTDLYFDFVFASEEYNEFAPPRISAFNDMMAIFVDGQNYAFVQSPNLPSNVPVSVNNVNRVTNFYYYVNNDPSDGGGYLDQFGYDGFTMDLHPLSNRYGLTLQAHVVLNAPGRHTFKIAVSDFGDKNRDSAVLVRAGSFTDQVPNYRVNQVRAVQGDKNLPRDQGWTIIEQNTVRNAANWGIAVSAGARDGNDLTGDPAWAHPGTPMPLRELNKESLVPGVTLVNNLLFNNGSGGIRLGGDSGASLQPMSTTAPIPFNDTAPNIQLALEALPVVGAGNVLVTANPNGSFSIQFTGALAGQAMTMTANGLFLTGPNAAATVTVQQAANGVLDQIYTLTITATGGVYFLTVGEPTVSVGGVPFVRIVNNTIYGGTAGPGASGTGILVEGSSSPTIINNIVANLATGIRIDDSSSSTELESNIYQNCATPVFWPTVPPGRNVLGEYSLVLNPNDPLFIRPDKGNFYLRPFSPAIDNSVQSLNDRAAMTEVRRPLGIADSPILAPTVDMYGQWRTDDPSYSPPTGPGTGGNAFVDRGAVERVDRDGPQAGVTFPLDNDAAGVDRNRRPNDIFLVEQYLNHFTIQLGDPSLTSVTGLGTGIADYTVVDDTQKLLPNRLIVLQDSGQGMTLLTEDINYTVRYNATQKTIDIFPVPGLWDQSTRYYLVLDNDPSDANATTDPSGCIRDLAGNPLQPNRSQPLDPSALPTNPDGTPNAQYVWQKSNMYFTVVFSGYDYGDAPDRMAISSDPTLANQGYPATLNYPVLKDDNGARHSVYPGFNLGTPSSISLDQDGKPSLDARGDAEESAIVLTPAAVAGITDNKLLVPNHWVTLTATVTVNSDILDVHGGYLHAWFDWNHDGQWEDYEHVALFTTNDQPGAYLDITIPGDGTPQGGAYTFTRKFKVDPTAEGGPVYARFRFTTAADMTSFGEAPDGSVEDYRYTVAGKEYGDAPNETVDPRYHYPTRNRHSDGTLEDGAWHLDVSSEIPLWLGNATITDPTKDGKPDIELDGQPTIDATGDDNNGDDEDGVNPSDLDFRAGQIATFNVAVHNPSHRDAYLDGWFDLNQNYTWDESTEHLVHVRLNADGTVPVSFAVPDWVRRSDPSHPPAARFRISTSDGLLSTGGADDGEVEDYTISLRPLAATFSGTVFNDLSRNGALDTNIGEYGMPGWTVNAVGTDGQVFSAVTGANGAYQLYVDAGQSYTVSEVAPAGWVQTLPAPVPPGTYTNVAAVVNTTVTGLDFGNYTTAAPEVLIIDTEPQGTPPGYYPTHVNTNSNTVTFTVAFNKLVLVSEVVGGIFSLFDPTSALSAVNGTLGAQYDFRYAGLPTQVAGVNGNLAASFIVTAAITSVTDSGSTNSRVLADGDHLGLMVKDNIVITDIDSPVPARIGPRPETQHYFVVDIDRPRIVGVDTIPASIVDSQNNKLPTPTNASTVVFKVTFSEPVQGVDNSDFELWADPVPGATGTITQTRSDTTPAGADRYKTWYVTVSGVTGAETNKLGLTLKAGAALEDLGRNPLDTSNVPFQGQPPYMIDRVAPAIVSITVDNAAVTGTWAPSGGVSPMKPTNKSDLKFLVTFSEPVAGVDIGDFQLDAPNVTLGTPVVAIGGPTFTFDGLPYATVWTMTVPNVRQQGALDGKLQLNLSNGASIRDQATNLLPAALPAGALVERYVVDQTPAQLKSKTAGSSNRTCTVTFDDWVDKFWPSGFASNGTPLPGSWTATLVGRNSTGFVPNTDIPTYETVYTVQATDVPQSLFPAGAVVDKASNKSAEIATPWPTVTVSRAPDQDTPVNQGPIKFLVSFSTYVTGFDLSDLDFSGSNAGGYPPQVGEDLTGKVTITTQTSDQDPSNPQAYKAYEVSCDGLTASGMLVLNVIEDAVRDASNLANWKSVASTSPANWVFYDIDPPRAAVLHPVDGGSIANKTVSLGALNAQQDNNGIRYIDVAFTANIGAGLSMPTIVDPEQEFTLTGPGGVVLTLDGADAQDSPQGNDRYRYRITSGSWKAGLWTARFPAGSFGDNAGNVNETATFTFNVADSTPPSVRLVDPPNGALLTAAQVQPLNTRGYIDIVYTANSGSAIDAASIRDQAPEFTLSGPGAGVDVGGAGYLLSNGAYRYYFTGTFKPGAVNVNFVPNSFNDSAGNMNVASTSTFTVPGATAPTLAIAKYSHAEGNSGTTTFTFNVTLSAASTQPVTVHYTTVDGTAKVADKDYAKKSGNLTFAAGTTRKTIAVAVTGDKKAEANETFKVTLSNASNATIATASGVGTITNDDLALSIKSTTVREGATASFTVTLSPAAKTPVTVRYATSAGTATSGKDFTAKSGTLTFAAGVKSKTITVKTLGDALAEATEKFTVKLSSPVGAAIVSGMSIGTGSITNVAPAVKAAAVVAAAPAPTMTSQAKTVAPSEQPALLLDIATASKPTSSKSLLQQRQSAVDAALQALMFS
jgi:parallel beta-helix repeat protein